MKKPNIRDIYDWNPVYNLVMEIKDTVLQAFGCLDYIDWNTVEDGKEIHLGSFLERWINNLGNQKYKDIFAPLGINSMGSMVLIRYANYTGLFNVEGLELTELTDFWNLYDGLYRECRSIVIDVESEEIILCPFKKFLNLGEGENTLESIIDRISKARRVEFSNKLDGSMQSATWYEGQLIMSGSQAIDRHSSWRLEDGYQRIMAQPNYINMLKDYENVTFIFEHITLANAHVVNYTEEQEGMYLIGMRNNDCFGHLTPYYLVTQIANAYGVRTTTIFNKTLDEVLEDCKIKKSNEMEGFVLNIDGELIKIKTDDYTHIHKILAKISSINLIIKNVADDTFDDLVAKVPQAYRARVYKIAGLVMKYVKDMDTVTREYFAKAPKDDRKTFMMWAMDKDNVPKMYYKYIVGIYLGKKNNYIKSKEECATPHYKKLTEMGYTNYKELFAEED